MGKVASNAPTAALSAPATPSVYTFQLSVVNS